MTVRINRVVTRGGDRGETSLGDSSRVRKDAPRIEALGAVDEANAALGLLCQAVAADAATQRLLLAVQNDLFDLGADLAVPDDGVPKGRAKPRIRVREQQVLALEAAITARNAALPPLGSFVLPGGSAIAAMAHLARAIVRRAERRAVALAAVEPLNPALLRYLNRLSDLLFVLAREDNEKSGGAPLWQPGGDASGSLAQNVARAPSRNEAPG